MDIKTFTYMPYIKQSDRYIISDCHFGHENITSFRKLKKQDGSLMSSEEQHELLMEHLCLVPKKATLFLLGDIAFDKYWLSRVSEIPCKNKILIVGNHDLDKKVSMKDLVETYDQVYSLHKYKKHWMSHAPIHLMELRGKKNIHGHTHPYLMLDEDGVPDTNYINVCCEYTGHKPIPWEYAISDEYHQECVIKWKYYMKEADNEPNNK